MKSETKFIASIVIATIIIVIGGVFLLSRQSTNNEPAAVVDNASITKGARHTIGNPDSSVTIVEFGDFQCPACRSAHPIVKQVLNDFPKTYFVWRNFPLTLHRNARPAAQAAEAASKQEKFWEMQDLLFERQDDWSDDSDPEDKFRQYAQELALGLDSFEKDYDEAKDIINQDFANANKFSVSSTPTFYINGQQYPGVVTYEQFKSIIEESSTQDQ